MEIIARGQATIYTQTDGYSVSLSRQSYVVPADKDGRVVSAVSVTTTVSALKGTTAVTPVIGTLPAVPGCTLSKSGTIVTVVFNVGTSLADSGTIDIPVTVDGNAFSLSFAYAKAKTGATGAKGTDASLLDWVADWDTGKTLIGQNSVITPKIFAGTKNANGTLTGIALGRFPLTVINTDGTTGTETVDGIYGFKDGNKTFFVDNGGNAQLGRGNQYIKYNASTGTVEFGSEVSLNWTQPINNIATALGGSSFPKLTYISSTGIYTGTLTAEQVNAVAINAGSITAGTLSADRIAAGSITAAKLDAASIKANIINTGYINGLSCTFVRGSIGNWTIDGNTLFRGSKQNAAGTFTAAAGDITIGTNGIRGCKWRMEATGDGAIAGGNISWDAAGNVTFASSVSLNWMNPVNSLTTALGGSSFPKLTYISSTGIYTGTLTAEQVNAVAISAGSIVAGTLSADRIATGSINASKLDATSIKSSIINTNYINGLSLTFDKGSIGGWQIEAESLYNNYIRMGKLLEVFPNYMQGFGIQMLSPYTEEECFCLSVTDSGDMYNHIAGWMFDEYCLWKNNVLLSDDGSIVNNSGAWSLNNDGSGTLANGNIAWTGAGTVTFSSSVSLNWTQPINNITSALGGSSFPKLTYISSTGIYTGTLTAAQVNAVAINAGSITAGVLSADRIAVGSITAAKLDAASIKSSIINTDYINGLNCTFTQGKIGGWIINSGSLSNTHIVLDNANKRVVVYGANASPTSGQRAQLYYNSDGDFGFLATNASGSGIACFGGSNYIAGWTVDTDAIFRGTKNNVSGAYTSTSGYITIGSTGIRGYRWRLDSSGAGAVAGGNISWDSAGNVSFASSVALNWKNYTDEKVSAVDGMTRNYAQDTSAEWLYDWSDCSENRCLFSYKVLSGNWKAGDVIYVCFDYMYDYIERDMSYNNMMCVQGSGDVTGWNSGFGLYDFMHLIDFENYSGSVHVEYSFTLNSEQARNNYFMINIRHDYIYADAYISNLMVTKGSKSSEWIPAQEDIKKRLTRITSSGIYTGTVSAYQVRVDSTLVVGGSSYNGSIAVRDASNNTKATLSRSGITAVGGTIGGWTIASNQISKNSVILSADGSIVNGTKWKLNNDGSGQFADGNISWTAAGTVTVTGTINASAGTIGGFEIGAGRIGSTASGTGSGGGLAIYNDLFRVGSSSSYVLFGDDTFPATAGGAFTATGRVTNTKSNTYFTNCGIYIDVKNASRNFGIYSNAALLAPALISNKIKTIVFSGSGYSIDFAQNNLFFIYGTANYGVNLPTESSVADMFGVSSLPSDFACVFTLVYNYNYSYRITINNVRNHDGNLTNFNMERGDTLTLICAKFPSFHYQMLNYRQS